MRKFKMPYHMDYDTFENIRKEGHSRWELYICIICAAWLDKSYNSRKEESELIKSNIQELKDYYTCHTHPWKLPDEYNYKEIFELAKLFGFTDINNAHM